MKQVASVESRFIRPVTFNCRCGFDGREADVLDSAKAIRCADYGVLPLGAPFAIVAPRIARHNL
jgi:hypothetical protein